MKRFFVGLTFVFILLIAVDAQAQEGPPCSLSILHPLRSVLCGEEPKEPEKPKQPKPNEPTTTTTLEVDTSTSTTTQMARPKQELPATG